MVDVLQVAHVLVQHALRHHPDEVDLIGYYGSHARGDAHAGSDLDVFYIPCEGASSPLVRTFLLEGVLFDFWEIPWSQMEAFATGAARGWAFAPGIVQQTVVLHARTDAQANRLRALQQRVAALREPAALPAMLRRARQAHAGLHIALAGMREAANAGVRGDVRGCGWQLVSGVLECLALLNQTPFRRGLSSTLSEVEGLDQKPQEVLRLLRTIATSADVALVLRAGEQLIADMRALLERPEGLS